MIVTLAGRRIDAPNAATRRFPLENAPLVRERIRRYLETQAASVLVCAAACGADLLALDAAAELLIRRRVVLPSDPLHFRAASVTDRPGDWGPLYDKIIDDARAVGDLVLLGGIGSGQEGLLDGNIGILREAIDLAGSLSPRHPAGSGHITALLVWDRVSRGAGDVTEHFGASARAFGLHVDEISTLSAASGPPRR